MNEVDSSRYSELGNDHEAKIYSENDGDAKGKGNRSFVGRGQTGGFHGDDNGREIVIGFRPKDLQDLKFLLDNYE